MEVSHQPRTLTAEERTYYEGLVNDWSAVCEQKGGSGIPITWNDLTPGLQHEVNIRGARQLFEGDHSLLTVAGVAGALVNEVFVPLLLELTGREFIDDGVVHDGDAPLP